MGVFYETIPKSLIPWILDQKMFWVATAPLSGSGHVNVSPKGGTYFGVIDEKTFWFLELTGSGCETLAHLHENGNARITIMLTAFDGPPKIVRLWGKGRALEIKSPEFESFVSKYGVVTIPGTRSIIIVDIHQVGSSCGFSVPYYEFKSFRDTLNNYFERKDKKYREGDEKESMDKYWAYKSQFSMDGLPAMKRAVDVGKHEKIAPIEKMVGPLAPKNKGVGVSGSLNLAVETVMLVAALSFFLGVIVTIYASSFASLGSQTFSLKHINASALWVIE